MSDLKGRSVFRAGKGNLQLYKDRAVEAIPNCLFEGFLKWPDPDEQQMISERIRADFKLPNCFLLCVTDGTLLPLVFWPSTEDYADYKKNLYTLTMLLVNDDERRIWYVNAGWPGSTHNDGVFQNSRIVQELEAHLFQDMEYR
jgi:hypothetical protein